ncbi:hypothetical protein Hanom_Chr01g00028751 [Helianthus anomalus]
MIMLFTSSLIFSKFGEHLIKTRRKANPQCSTRVISSKQRYLRWISEYGSSCGIESSTTHLNHRPNKD